MARMNAAKRGSAASRLSSLVGNLLPRLPSHAGWLLAGGFVLVLLLGIGAAWKAWGPQLLGRAEYRLSEESLHVTPQPAWIDPATNVKAEAIRDGSLLNVNLLDEQAAVKIARAFELNTWVKRVVRVRKRAPASVDVELEYRQPVALVEVLYNNVLSYEPVDMDGVVLPEDMFHRDTSQLDQFLRITSDYSMPAGPLGTVWSDERIVGAANLAALLDKGWRDWNLYRIVAGISEELDRKPVYELRTRGHSRILWGHRPGGEAKGEPDSLQKITWLAEYIRRQGPLDQGSQPPVVIDVRSGDGLQVQPASVEGP